MSKLTERELLRWLAAIVQDGFVDNVIFTVNGESRKVGSLLDRANALLAQPLAPSAQYPSNEQVELAKNKLLRAVWDWGESCGVDGVGFNERGDSFNENTKTLAHDALKNYATLVAERAAAQQREKDGVGSEGIDRAAAVLYERIRNLVRGNSERHRMPEWDSARMLPETQERYRDDVRAVLAAIRTQGAPAIKEAAKGEASCIWRQDDDGNWDTDCGEKHILIDGDPQDNFMRFCCYCGFKIGAQAQDTGRSE